MEPVYWLIAVVVLVLIEIVTLGLTTIWFAGGALLAFLVALGANTMIQVIVFLVASFLLLFFTKPIATKYFNGKRVRTNSESLIGQEAKVTAKIDNFNQQGTVVVNGLEWSARTVDDTVIESGEAVIILEISGVKLIVKKKEE